MRAPPALLLPVLALLLPAATSAASPAASPQAAAPAASPSAASPAPNVGYYRQPTLRGDALVFVAEGDLWRTGTAGGRATRLTTHAGAESSPALSPDGAWLAFTATYEGMPAAYVMPTAGGLPRRLTWNGTRVSVVGWSPDGKALVATDARSTLPALQIVRIDPTTGAQVPLPLAQASEGSYTASGVFVFTRLAFQGSQTARYQGGTAQNLWRWDPAHPAVEATPLTSDHPGTSKNPMAWNGRIYFLSDRDGTMNLWSMAEDGSGLTQHTRSVGWDLQSAALDAGRIAYRVGADLHLLDLASGDDRAVPITLDSDLDQLRENWVADPMAWASAFDLSPDGERVAITARGGVWVVPKVPGRVVTLANTPGVRWRGAEFTADGASVIGLSDATGEVELAELPADGSAPAATLTTDGQVLRFEVEPSPDGAWIAHTDKNQRLWLYSRAKKTSTLVASSPIDMPAEPTFSPDSKLLAWVEPGANTLRRIHVQDLASGAQQVITTDRYDASNPVFSPDGHWLYFLSDRTFVSSVDSPWGAYAPQPHFPGRTGIYALALQPGLVSPFQPPDELHPKAGDAAPADDPPAKPAKGKKKKGEDAAAPELPAAVLDGLADRLWPVPVPAGDYSHLSVTNGALYWNAGGTDDGPGALQALAIGDAPPEVKTVVDAIDGYQISRDGARVLIVKEGALSIADVTPDTLDLSKAGIDLSGWTFSVDPRSEWRQMFTEAWRLERDYFYATTMHGVDWNAMLARYRPLVDRVRSRAELSDLIAQMVSQLSALHTFVRGGDLRVGDDWVATASLGATWTPVDGGLRVDHIYASDPDLLTRRSPLHAPGVDVREGDVLTSIDYRPIADEAALASALRARAGHPVLLGYLRGKTPMKALVTPLDPGQDQDLRYLDWEISRRRRVEQAGAGTLGYVHLRAMGQDDIAQWTRDYFPVFNRQGLIIDVRHNRGGNIDSWILGQLLRRPWFYWSQRVGAAPSWDMQYAFRGPVVVLCDESTASDGEAFTEGIRRLGIGHVIGMRTWGGEIWLSSSNYLVDGGIATAAEFGVYGPEGEWLIEGHGVEPDEVVDNLPRATYDGGDAQLEAAIRYLQAELKAHPVQELPHPAFPDKSLK